ncbi:Phage tail collar domain containing protein [uncultured Caudovirales phage]|uniref:Phage tail collar domain containing protein n=1 Tax=uncultured Caudovirales phage TaxID=2100421 RepID=A0A6J5LA30_9CAUD|nr:Phage tail collar domain containing protein [uncultured Caudovirales phage]
MKKIVTDILQKAGLRTPDQEVSVKNWAASLLVTKISEVLNSLDKNKADRLHSHVEFDQFKNKADVNHTHESSVPVGAIFAFPVDGEVPGYLKCNGSAHLISHYPKLAALLTTFKPATLAQDKFVVPDFRGQYLRGADDAASSVIATTGLTDPNTGAATTNSKTAGIRAGDSFGQHKHPVTDPMHNHQAGQTPHGHSLTYSVDYNNPVMVSQAFPLVGPAWVDGLNDTGGSGGGTDFQQPQVFVVPAYTGITVNNSGEAETRPKSVLVNYYIKCDQ